MLTINKLIPRGQGLAAALLKRAPEVVLDWDTRQKSRFDARDSQDRALAVFLPRGSTVRGGDVLVAEDGSLLRVIAAEQALLEVRACAEHGSPFDLMRAAYHLGNRHVAVQVGRDEHSDWIRIQADHVLQTMLLGLGAAVQPLSAAFEPEAGAYAPGHHHAERGATEAKIHTMAEPARP